MQSKFPDFFMISDPEVRKNAIKEYKRDHRISDEDFNAIENDQYQLEGSQMIKRILAIIANDLKEISIDEIYDHFSNITMYPREYLKLLYK